MNLKVSEGHSRGGSFKQNHSNQIQMSNIIGNQRDTTNTTKNTSHNNGSSAMGG